MAELATTKQGSDVVEHATDAVSIKKCLDFPESADYLLSRLIEKLKSVGLLEKADELVEKVREYVDVVHKQRSLRGQPWDADPACERTDFQNLQANLAEEALERLTVVITDPMKMDYALSDLAEFVRGFSVNGKPLSPELLDFCDKLFNAWLAENNLLSKGGKIYEVSDKGIIRKDGKGAPMTANADRVKELLNDPVKSFQVYLANGKQSIQLITKEHPYPEQKPKTKPVIKAREEAPEAGVAAEPSTPQFEKEGGVTPSSGSGGGAAI